MKRLIGTLSLMTALVVACVTINIYFPAEEVRSAADKIVSEVYGERAGQPTPPTPPATEQPGPGSYLRQLFGPATAFAQEQDVNISTPEIRAIRDSMKARNQALLPFLDGGQVGIGTDGLLAVRTADGLGLKERAEVNRLVNAENADRRRLYEEIARANGFPEKVGEVQEIFARTWREKARGGWYLEQPGGGWTRK